MNKHLLTTLALAASLAAAQADDAEAALAAARKVLAEGPGAGIVVIFSDQRERLPRTKHDARKA